MTIRRALMSDIPAITNLYRQTILEVNRRDYTDAQVRAWSARADDTASWERRISTQHFYLGLAEAQLQGFISMTGEGHIDLLFVDSRQQGRGIAALLLRTVEAAAQSLQCPALSADVSITARPFFEKQGFGLVREQRVAIAELEFINFRMLKPMDSGMEQPDLR